MTAIAGRRAGIARWPLARLALAGFLAACASARPNPFDEAYATTITIEVLNLNWNQATLHALRGGGERERLGIVGGTDRASFVVDWPVSLPLRLEIDILAGGACVTRAIQADPGDEVYLEIHADLRTDPDCESREAPADPASFQPLFPADVISAMVANRLSSLSR